MQRPSVLLLLPLTLLGASESELAESSSYDSLADADAYLQTVGVEQGLPQLIVKYEVGSWGRKVEVEGGNTHFKVPDDVRNLPIVQWEPLNDANGNKRKFVLMMVAPDEPERASTDGASAGTAGPRIVWLMLNCVSDAKSGNELFQYQPPAPAANTGTHRYILILFQQTSPPKGGMDALREFIEVYTRDSWGLADFVRKFKDSMQPVAINFFYGSQEGPQAELEGGGADPQPAAGATPPPQEQKAPPQKQKAPLKMKPPAAKGAMSLGPQWATPRPAHDLHDEL